MMHSNRSAAQVANEITAPEYADVGVGFHASARRVIKRNGIIHPRLGGDIRVQIRGIACVRLQLIDLGRIVNAIHGTGTDFEMSPRIVGMPHAARQIRGRSEAPATAKRHFIESRDGIESCKCRRIVGASDGGAHSARHAAAMTIQHIEAEALYLGLARSQVLDGCIGDAVIPAHHPARAVARGVGAYARGQRA